MLLEDFDFSLPPELIAQEPLPKRDASRLLVVSRKTPARSDRTFAEFPQLLSAGDLLVMNDAKVIPARLIGTKTDSGGKAELLLVRPAASLDAGVALQGRPEEVEWICLGQSSKGFRAGMKLTFALGLRATVVEARGEGEYLIRFFVDGAIGDSGAALESLLKDAGRLPLPPYIERAPRPEDADRYQTVYANKLGSVAAPTAGLHFSTDVLEALERAGIQRALLTLDVGPGTFLPVRESSVDAHRMHSERFYIPEATAMAVNQARNESRRVIAVGTTVVRTLESATDDSGNVRAGVGDSALFIRPGYNFRQIQGLLTNFHLPRSTLLMLVAAFAGHAQIMDAYRAAVAARYRFFSYGDAMLVI